MAAFPIPGEAAFESSRNAGDLLIVRNVRLGVLNAGQRLDAVLDTGATDCIVPTRVARLLGFDHDNRMGWRVVRGLGGSSRMNVHALEYLRVGTAQAHRVRFLAGDIPPPFSRFMLLGLSFLKDFNVTLDFDNGRAVFRGRDEDKVQLRVHLR